jgi:peptidoglycan hydrolase-like protein with peptidoglycan-binding domain
MGHEVRSRSGTFGPRTRAAIAAWQKQQGLPETGFLTAIQLANLRQQAAAALAKYDEDQKKLETSRSVEAALHLSDDDRKRVQVALGALGHDIGSRPTGYFGRRTRAMITAWQKAQGQPETGYLTASQLADLRLQAAPALAKYDAEQKRLETAEAAETGLASDDDRKRVQAALNALGYDIGTSPTGYFGPRTRAMISAWQKAQGIADTGYLTAPQLAMLRQQAAAASSGQDREGQ